MDDGDGFRFAITRSSRNSMSRPGRRGLQLDDSPPDPLPNGSPFEVAAFKHQVGAPGRSKLGIVTMLPDQQVGGSPDIEVGDHRCERMRRLARSAVRPTQSGYPETNREDWRHHPGPLRRVRPNASTDRNTDPAR
jgi:hypothetical protein